MKILIIILRWIWPSLKFACVMDRNLGCRFEFAMHRRSAHGLAQAVGISELHFIGAD
jgi:hypothetical protein